LHYESNFRCFVTPSLKRVGPARLFRILVRKAVFSRRPLLAGTRHREPPRDDPLPDSLLTLVGPARLNECRCRSNVDPRSVAGDGVNPTHVESLGYVVAGAAFCA